VKRIRDVETVAGEVGGRGGGRPKLWRLLWRVDNPALRVSESGRLGLARIYFREFVHSEEVGDW
jgi:hypothetical protein